MDENTSDSGETETVGKCKSRSEKEWRIRFICSEIKVEICIEHTGDIVSRACVVVADGGRNWHPFAVPYIREVENWRDKPDPEDKTSKNVCNCPERRHQWGKQVTSNLSPIDCERDDIQAY